METCCHTNGLLYNGVCNIKTPLASWMRLQPYRNSTCVYVGLEDIELRCINVSMLSCGQRKFTALRFGQFTFSIQSSVLLAK